MRLTKTFTGVVVANLLMTILTVMATRHSRNARQNGSPMGTNSEITSLLSGSWNGNPDVLRNFTPTPPSPEEVECQIQVKRDSYNIDAMRNLSPTRPSIEHVECRVQVKRTELLGGRCIQLLGSRGMFACQSGDSLDPYNQMCRSLYAEADNRGRTRGRRRRGPRRRSRSERSPPETPERPTA